METTDGVTNWKGCPDPGLAASVGCTDYCSNSVPLPYQDTLLLHDRFTIQQDLQPTHPSVSLALPRSQAKFWKKKKTKMNLVVESRIQPEKVNKVTSYLGFLHPTGSLSY